MQLFKHFTELKYRLIFYLVSVIFSTGLIYTYFELFLIEFCPNPGGAYASGALVAGFGSEGATALKWVFTNLSEVSIQPILFSFFLATLFNSPLLLFHLYLFFRPGLYLEENRTIKFLGLFWLLLLTPSCLLYYFLIVKPFIYKFFFSFQTLHLLHLPKLSETLLFSCKILIIPFWILSLILFVFIYCSLTTRPKVLVTETSTEPFKGLRAIYGTNEARGLERGPKIWWNKWRSRIYWLILLIFGILGPPIDPLSLLRTSFPFILLLEVSFFLLLILSLWPLHRTPSP